VISLRRLPPVLLGDTWENFRDIVALVAEYLGQHF
jgi:hypothetical protein